MQRHAEYNIQHEDLKNFIKMEDVASFITSLPSWVFFLLTLAIGLLATVGGAWLAQRRVKRGITEPEASVNTAVSAILGLLAFMLGFTFSITSSRFADRRQLVVQQANAIGTCYLRTSLIPEKQKLELRKLFHEYIVILLNVKNAQEVEKELLKLDNVHVQIWNQTASLVDEKMDPELRSLFTSSVNEVIDLASERQTVALIFRISGFIWISLLLLYTVSMLAIGYQTGTKSARKDLGMPILEAAALALVIMMIADMDSPGRGRFQVSQQPLVDVQRMMQKEIR